MNRYSRLLSTLYVLTSGLLAWTAVLQYRYGPLWAAFLFTAASLVPTIAVVRESVIGDQQRALAELSAGPRGQGERLADTIVRRELDAACCERWWTSLGTDHDAACAHRAPRSSAA
ncbi:hypothetical protein [Streptomyces sp. DH24]|uniref:hypothetical protein n=1 Tax=Streptomyces sp. DH24 TaxID=3040123 RepID=UPI00244227A1|nr:hypothetical protein [Streptomyces sp. DH24]MDG9720424.1 hypothetical protein [Streptomyces sp. DH24]